MAAKFGDPSRGYVCRHSALSDGPAINALYNRVTKRARTLAHWHWLWHEAPGGPGESWVIEHQTGEGPQIIGHHGVIRLQGACDGRPIRVGKTENTFVAPEHRHRMLYPMLERRMLGEYSADFDGVFTFQAPETAARLRSASGYRSGNPLVAEYWVKGLPGWWSLCRAGLRSRGGSPHGIGAWDVRVPRGDGWISELTAGMRAQIDRCSNEMLALTGVRLARTADFIAWRYLRHPAACYAVAEQGSMVVVAHEFRRHILIVDELLPGEVSDISPHEKWHELLSLIRCCGYSAIRFSAVASNGSHAIPLRTAGWRLARRWNLQGRGATDGPPIWVNPASPHASQLLPHRWVLGVAGSEGP